MGLKLFVFRFFLIQQGRITLIPDYGRGNADKNLSEQIQYPNYLLII